MPKIAGIPVIGWIQMTAGAVLLIFILIKYIASAKRKKGGEYIIRHVHIITGDGSESFDRSVYIKNGIIREISDNDVTVKSARIIDGSGKTLMPGLIDAHIHIQGLNNRSKEESDRFLYGTVPDIFKDKILPYGITSVRDMCSPRSFIFKLRDEVKKGKITGPEIIASGPNFTAPDGHPANTLGGNNPWIRSELAIEASTPEQISSSIARLKREGADFLKLTYQGGDYWYFNEKLQINKLKKELMQQIIKEGKKNGFKTSAHVFYKEDVRELLEAGIYSIEHGILDEELSPDDDIIGLWKKSGAWFVPTVNAMTYEKDPLRLKNSLHNLKVLYDAGIPVAMGTDSMFEMLDGSVEHKELAFYVEAGLTPMQAITLAAKNAAEHLGISDRKGQVKEGMEADLILLDGDPAKDISNMSLIDTVFLRGKIVYSQRAISSYDIPDYEYPQGISVMRYEYPDGGEREVDVSRYGTDKTVRISVYRNNELLSEETHTAAGDLSDLKWHYVRQSDNTDLTAEKSDGYITMTGTFKGRPQNKRFKIGGGLWYQMMDMAMPAFINSDQKEIVFYSIGTGDNRGAMGLGEFAAEKEGEENITVGGISYDCIKVSIVLTMFSWAWKGINYYDKKTGQIVKSCESGKGTSEKEICRLLSKSAK